MNVTQSALSICDVFRASEGITTVVSLLQNDYLNQRLLSNDLTLNHASSFTEKSSGSNHSITPSLFSSLSLSQNLSQNPTQNFNQNPTQNHSGYSLAQKSTPSPSVLPLTSQRLSDTGIRKVVLYLTGILMNISRLDAASCVEIGQLGGVEVLVQMIQVTREKQIVYCLECIRACCRHDESCKVGDRTRHDPIDANGDKRRHHQTHQLFPLAEQPGGTVRAEHRLRGAEQTLRQHPPVLPGERPRRADADRGELEREVRLHGGEGDQQRVVQWVKRWRGDGQTRRSSASSSTSADCHA